MSTTVEPGTWEEIGVWWDTFLDNRSLVDVLEATETLERSWVVGQWKQLDAWWDVSVESQREALAELQEVFESGQKRWRESGGSFDEDPLHVDWASNPRTTGPLRINQEENWSQWLAHTIRSGPPAFSRELFGVDFEGQPSSVDREVHLADHSGTDRYADVLLSFGGQNVSVEVKRGDSHYEKTVHTASLIESQFGGEWEHYLLLPRYMTDPLRRSFPEDLDEPANDRPTINSDQSDDITVLYWQDVSEAIRNTLLAESDFDPHWEASAYLLCTLVEQKIAQFIPKPTIDRMTSASDVVRSTSSMSLRGGDIEDQVAYVRRTMEGPEHE